MGGHYYHESDLEGGIMAYFPFFIDIAGKQGLIVGGGKVAYRKAEKLLPYGVHLTVVAPNICPQLQRLAQEYSSNNSISELSQEHLSDNSISLLIQDFEEMLLQNQFFVIAATDNHELNHHIVELCQENHILVNVVDDTPDYGFLFPSLIQQGSCSIGISTAGASPNAAIYLKEKIQTMIPEHFGDCLDYLAQTRPLVKQRIFDENLRKQCFSDLFTACLTKQAPLNAEEFDTILNLFEKSSSTFSIK